MVTSNTPPEDSMRSTRDPGNACSNSAAKLAARGR